MSHRINLQDGTGVIATVPGYGIVHAAGETVPADNDPGYAIGCLFSHLDGTDGSALWVNEGTNLLADFNLIVVTAA